MDDPIIRHCVHIANGDAIDIVSQHSHTSLRPPNDHADYWILCSWVYGFLAFLVTTTVPWSLHAGAHCIQQSQLVVALHDTSWNEASNVPEYGLNTYATSKIEVGITEPRGAARSC